MMSADEYLDIVDDDDNVIGRKSRSEVYALRQHNYRVVNAFIVNSEGKLWIPRRTAAKRIFPLCLDVSMGGHVESGETYAEALARELKEELNLEIYSCSYRFMGKLSHAKHGVSAFMEVYEILSDREPEYNKEDFVEASWLYPEDVIERLNRGDKSKDDLPRLVKRFYL